MYATIIQSAVNAATVRQTVIIPSIEGTPVTTYTRLGAGQRGTAGAWAEVAPQSIPEVIRITAQSPLVGEPTSVRITPSDERDIVSGSFPGTLLQKLVRAVKGHEGPSTTESGTEAEVIGRILSEASTDPEALVRYIRSTTSTPVARPEKVTPSVEQVEHLSPAPSVAEAQSEPVMAWTDLSVPTMDDPVVAGYVERTFSGGKTETEVYDFARERSEAVNIVGPAGTGKTSSARAYAAKRGLPFVVFECNPQVDEEVVQGTYIPTGKGNELVWRYSALATALTQPSVVLLNESNRMTARSNALFLAILQERELKVSRHRGEVLAVHPECLIIADSNDGYRGTQKSDQAFLDRFNVKVEFAYDREVEAAFIPSTSLLDFATRLRAEADREDTFTTPVSTRLLKNFVSQARGLGWDFAYQSFLNNFPVTERDALGMVFTTFSENIKQELGLLEEAVVSSAGEDDDLIDVGF